MLNYIDDEYIVNNVVSSDISINPYDSFTFAGSMTLNPPGDTWYDQTTLPLIYKDDLGTYDTLIPDTVGVSTYGSVWNSWKQFWYSPANTDQVKAIDKGAVITNASVTGSSTSVVFPYVRNASIRFNAKRLKPNTKMYVFFNEYDVTKLCYSANTTANVVSFDNDIKNQSNIITDAKGTVTGVFNFDVNTSGLKIPAGTVKLRLTDSPTNGTNKESFADAVYVANGTLNKVEPVRTVYNSPIVNTSYAVGGGTSANPGVSPSPGNPNPTPTPGSPSITNTVPSKGLIDYALSYLKGVDLGKASAADLAKYEKFYQDACIKDGTTVAKFETGLTALNTSNGAYGIKTLRDDPNSNAENFNFKSGAAAATAVGNPGYITEHGVAAAFYGTATNILSAVNGNGQTYVSQLQAGLTGSGVFENVVMPLYTGTVTAITDSLGLAIDAKGNQTISGTPTADQQAFYDVGVKNGSFAAGDIATAINQYAAATTLAFIEAPETAGNKFANSAVDDAAANGIRG
jgi:hypothetical protein